MPYFHFIITCLTGLLLTACSTFTPTQLPWAQRQAQLNHITQWHSSGVVGIRTPTEAWSATFNWEQHPERFHLQLFAPLGAGNLILSGNAQQTELINSKGEHYQASTVEALLAERTGWYLPVSLLRYWILGKPAPKLSSQLAFDQYHRLSVLHQAGWTVNYQHYQIVNNIELPTALELSNQYFKIRLIIKHWNL